MKMVIEAINQVIQTYQTRITQGLKDIDHKHHQTFIFVKGNLKTWKVQRTQSIILKTIPKQQST